MELIIPTLWKSDNLDTMLKRYVDSKYVSKIHLMDNGREFYDRYRMVWSNKLVVYTPGVKNQWMVNEAWNIGVRNCSDGSIVGILNDDILFSTDVFEFLEKNIYGIVGMHSENYKLLKDTGYEIVDIPHHMYGWGCMYFMKKEQWVDIPQPLRVYFGDTWHFHSNPVRCKALTGLAMAMSSVSKTVTSPDIVSDVSEMYKAEWDWFSKNVQQNNLNVGIF